MFGQRKRIRELEREVDEWRKLGMRYKTFLDKQQDLTDQALIELDKLARTVNENKLSVDRLSISAVAVMNNRSRAQSEMLLALCDNNILDLVTLEVAIKRQHITYCPDTEEEVYAIIKQDLKSQQSCQKETETSSIKTDS